MAFATVRERVCELLSGAFSGTSLYRGWLWGGHVSVSIQGAAIEVRFDARGKVCRSWVECFPLGALSAEYLVKGGYVVSKYLAAARAKSAHGRAQLDCADPFLFKDRPALQELMTLLVDDAGECREASVLMLCPRADGFSVGIKCEEAGGWFWKNGQTVSKALDLIEKAIQGSEAVFSSSEKRAASRGKR